jgi:uncharacterized protein YjiS (DUF1127 family)
MGQSQASCPRLTPHPQQGQGSLGRRMLAATQRAWTCYWLHRAARATTGVLYALDDRALKDIGLDRSEVESVAYGNCGRSAARAADRRVCLCH